jgi:large subunit ribosomal protein L23
MNLLLAPHISEKSTRQGDASNQYVFKVMNNASKPDIKRAVEMMFNVKVESVRVCNVRGKIKRFGQTYGIRSGWKKAYVKLAAGNEIALAGAESA